MTDPLSFDGEGGATADTNLQCAEGMTKRRPLPLGFRTVVGVSPNRAATMCTGTPEVSASVAAVWRKT